MSSQRLVLVIGGTRGTGLLIARLLHQRGTKVRVLARDPDRARRELGAAAEVVHGDITKPATLPAAMAGASDIVFTAGCRSARPARESTIIATEYDGVRNTLAAAKQAGFAGRFLYMTSSGVNSRSFWARCLNLYKGNTLIWRRRAEDDIRDSGLRYTIIRAGMLVNRPSGTRAVEVSQRELELSPRYRIARADVAEAFVTALDHACTPGSTFEIVWGRGPRRESWDLVMHALMPDAAALAKILFVCVENSNRSQMAEAFARMLGAGLVDAHSAGSKPSGIVNPLTIAAMRERGYELSGHRSKPLTDVPPGPYAAVVTMGCGDACPWIPAERREDWVLPDPKLMGPDGLRAVRDEIERRVVTLLKELRR